ncbi:MAG: hypothetical protein ABI745_05200 [Caldimonas sp.]
MPIPIGASTGCAWADRESQGIQRRSARQVESRKQKAARRRLSAVLANRLYFIAPEEAFMAPEAASIADDAASIADVAADEAEFIAELAAEAASPIDGAGVTTTAAGAGVVVVVVSSFLLHAAKETAAARVTISSAVFMFLLDFGSDNER